MPATGSATPTATRRAGWPAAISPVPIRTRRCGQAENLHYVGAVGEPAFQNGWGNLSSFNHKTTFYKDREGVVHFTGTVTGGTFAGNAIFTFDACLRTLRSERQRQRLRSHLRGRSPTKGPPARASGGSAWSISPAGAAVTADVGAGRLTLDGITWRADGC